jgi:hypothetical protein
MSKKSADERRSARANVLLVASIEYEGRSIPVKVANLSAHGARVSSAGLPGEDAAVVLRCNGTAVDGWIAWLRAPHAGIHFGSVIEHSEVLRKMPEAKPPILKDTRKLDYRRPGFRGKQLTDDERQILVDWRASQ